MSSKGKDSCVLPHLIITTSTKRKVDKKGAATHHLDVNGFDRISFQFHHFTQVLMERDLRKKVLHGDFMNSVNGNLPLHPRWRVPRWKLLVFVSSTFTDTYHERNILLGSILPRLRERARAKIEVSFVDMR
jgi:hypothetical protein